MCFGGEADDIAEQERHRAAAEALTEACASVAQACIAAGGTLDGFEIGIAGGGADIRLIESDGNSLQCSIDQCLGPDDLAGGQDAPDGDGGSGGYPQE